MGSIVTPPRAAYHATRSPALGALRALRLGAAALALAWGLFTGPSAGAEPDERPLRMSVGAGWSGALTGPPSHGPLAHLALLPGGPFERVGLHTEIRGLSGGSPQWLLGGLSYEAGAARPHLKVDLRAEAGAVLGDRIPVAGAGARWHVWVFGPLAVGIDSAAHLWIDGVDSELVISGALSLGIAI